jgi:hypothetical protein
MHKFTIIPRFFLQEPYRAEIVPLMALIIFTTATLSGTKIHE